MQSRIKNGILLTLLVSLAAGLPACGGSSAPSRLQLDPAPASLKFNGAETRSVTIRWDDDDPIAVVDEYITGPDRSSFLLPSGQHCEVEYSSLNKECAEIVHLKKAQPGLRATLVVGNEDGILEIPLRS